MGVNCKATLTDARWEIVGKVGSILLGAKATKRYFENSPSKGWVTDVAGFEHNSFKKTSMAEYIYILMAGDENNPAAKLIKESDGMPYHAWYNLEERLLYPKATAAKIALAVGITKFFGGKIVYNDCTDAKTRFRKPAGLSFAETDKAWYSVQEALLKLKPLTRKDIDRVAKYAAY